MKSRSIISIVLSIAAAVLLCACTLDGTIYKTIELVTRTTDNSLPNTMTVFDIVKFASNTYYVATGTVYKGVLKNIVKDGVTTIEVTWTPNDTEPKRVYNPGGTMSNALGFYATNGTLWGGFITTTGVLGVYESSIPPSRTWTAVTDPVIDGKQVTLVQPIDATGEIFVVAATRSGNPETYHYELDYSADGSSWAVVSSGHSSPITGVVYDGTEYYMASGSTVFHSITPTGPFTASLTLPPVENANGADEPDEAEGIFAVTGKVLVATKRSGVRFHTTAWEHVGAPTNPNDHSIKVRLLAVAGPVGTGSDKFLVGSDGYGYYSLSLSAKKLTRFNGSTIDLYSASIRRILFDSANRAVFMGTNGAGLWRAKLAANGDLVTPDGDSVALDGGAATTASAWTQE